MEKRIDAEEAVMQDYHLKLASRLLPAVMLAAGFLLWPAAICLGDQLSLKVSRAEWAQQIAADREVEISFEDFARPGPLYLWMEVRGKRQALAHLADEGKLPIVHVWVRYLGQVPVEEEGVPVDKISLDIGSKEMLSKLRYELNQRGFFDWRTWSMKESVPSHSLWRVFVEYNDGSPVMCDGKQCVYEIRVR
jgi:hypothetical protein